MQFRSGERDTVADIVYDGDDEPNDEVADAKVQLAQVKKVAFHSELAFEETKLNLLRAEKAASHWRCFPTLRIPQGALRVDTHKNRWPG